MKTLSRGREKKEEIEEIERIKTKTEKKKKTGQDQKKKEDLVRKMRKSTKEIDLALTEALRKEETSLMNGIKITISDCIRIIRQYQ